MMLRRGESAHGLGNADGDVQKITGGRCAWAGLSESSAFESLTSVGLQEKIEIREQLEACGPEANILWAEVRALTAATTGLKSEIEKLPHDWQRASVADFVDQSTQLQRQIDDINQSKIAIRQDMLKARKEEALNLKNAKEEESRLKQVFQKLVSTTGIDADEALQTLDSILGSDKPYTEFEVTVSTPLGLELGFQNEPPRSFMIHAILMDGGVSDWNKEYSDIERVRKDDHIVGVNGVTSDLEAMTQELSNTEDCEDGERIVLTIRRYAWRDNPQPGSLQATLEDLRRASEKRKKGAGAQSFGLRQAMMDVDGSVKNRNKNTRKSVAFCDKGKDESESMKSTEPSPDQTLKQEIAADVLLKRMTAMISLEEVQALNEMDFTDAS